jgi:hypothetical protein
VPLDKDRLLQYEGTFYRFEITKYNLFKPLSDRK